MKKYKKTKKGLVIEQEDEIQELTAKESEVRL